MSGGSYNYLCYADSDGVRNSEESLTHMANRLAGLPYAQDAAKETAALVLLLRQQETWVQAYIDRLKDVWHAVEWWDSGEEDVKQALETYRAGTCQS